MSQKRLPASHGPRRVLHDDQALFHRAVSVDGLLKGWEKVWSNKGGAGGDGITAEMFFRDSWGWINRLSRSLKSGQYRPGRLRRVEIPKSDGRRVRRLDIPCISDRVVQSAVAQVLSPVFEEEFEPSSFAYRPGRSVQQAVAQVSAAQAAGFEWFVDADIEDFFGSVNHDLMLARLGESLEMGPLTNLVMLWLTHASPKGVGLAQGSPLSPLLANLFLDRVDEAFFSRGSRFVRFADDFVIMTKTQGGAKNAVDKADQLLAEHGLKLNRDKTRVLDFNRGLTFLGHLFVRSLVTKVSGEIADEQRIATWMRDVAKHDEAGVRDRAARETEEKRQSRAGFVPAFRVLYVYQSGRRLGVRNQTFVVEECRDEALGDVKGNWRELIGVHHSRLERIEIGSKASISVVARELALASDVMIAYVNGRGETKGWTGGALAPRAKRHLAQAKVLLDEGTRLELASRIVTGRIRNQRAVLRRLARGRDERRDVVEALVVFNKILGRGDKSVLRHAVSVSQLLGHEGHAAKVWWRAISALMPQQFRFSKRTRRAETNDGVNAMFNMLAWLLMRDVSIAVDRAGLHPGFGVLHSTDNARDACCYDLAEEFRAHLIGGLTVYCVNKKIVTFTDFTRLSDGGVQINRKAGDALIRAYEKRVAREVKSPRTGKKITWRRLMIEQAFVLVDCFENGTIYKPYDMGY